MTIVQEWLQNLLENEIKQELGSISNCRIWQKGVTDNTTIEMYDRHIQAHEEYIEVLKKIKEEYLGKK